MNSDQIFDAIEEIAAVSGKKEKEALVAKYCEHQEFRDVLVAALDPLVTYGMQDVPPNEYEGDDCSVENTFSSDTWGVLTKLACRDLSGNAAWDAVEDEMAFLSEKSAELLKRIIRKDLRAGFGDSTVNKAVKGLIKTFPYERCSLPNKVNIAEWDWPRGIISQEKADGMFANVDHEESGIVRITSRQGSEFPAKPLQSFMIEVRKRLTPGTQTHGEFLVKLDGTVLPRAESNGVMNRVLKGGDFEEGEELIYQIWNQIPLSAVEPKGKHDVAYSARLADIIRQLNVTDGEHISLISTRMCRSLEEAYQHCFELLKQNKEGTIIKQLEGTWRDGTAKHQVKLKLEVDVDLVVTAIVPGRDNTKNEGRAGSLTCETACGQLIVDVAVKNEKMRKLVDDSPEDWIGRVIVVRANDILKPSESNENYSLFLPRMAEDTYRTDKTVADTLEQVQDQFDSAIDNIVAKLKEAA